MSDISRREAVARLWELGNLQWKLDSTQKQLYASYHNNPNKTIVWACSRRIGKSYCLVGLAVEVCEKTPGVVVKFVAPKQKQIRTILRPIFHEILRDCPQHLRPKYLVHEGCWRFPNGSEIQLAGTDNGNAENLRGGTAHLCIVDEAGFCDDLDYLVQSILLPTMTTTDGKIILSSTPPISPDHPFIRYMQRAEEKGAFMKKTVYDCPRLTKEQIEDMAREVGGIDSIAFRREFLMEIIIDKNRAVVPEWSPELENEIVRDWDRPPFFDKYVAMDIGWKDLTIVLFAYYDFKHDKLIIEDEFVVRGPEMTTDALANAIKAKELLLWKDPNTHESIKPYLRISDNNLIVINDLQVLHELTFIPTSKDDSNAALNQMRMHLNSKKIIIAPKCKTLVSHLKNGTWNPARTSFDRSSDFGHYDAIDALKYLVRNISYTRNPYPENYDMPKGPYFESEYYREQKVTPIMSYIKDMFTVRSSINKKKQS